MTESKDLHTIIVFAAFSIMIVAVGAVGYFAITPMQRDIIRLENEAGTIVSRDETNKASRDINDRIGKMERACFNDIISTRGELNSRFDSIRDDLNNRIALMVSEINRLKDEIDKLQGRRK